MTAHELAQQNLTHWQATRAALETYPDALDSERRWLDTMVESTLAKLKALGNSALAPMQVLMGEEGQGE